MRQFRDDYLQIFITQSRGRHSGREPGARFSDCGRRARAGCQRASRTRTANLRADF